MFDVYKGRLHKQELNTDLMSVLQREVFTIANGGYHYKNIFLTSLKKTHHHKLWDYQIYICRINEKTALLSVGSSGIGQNFQ